MCLSPSLFFTYVFAIYISHANSIFKKGKSNSVQLAKVFFGIKPEQELHRTETVLHTRAINRTDASGLQHIRPLSTPRSGPPPPLSPAGNAKAAAAPCSHHHPFQKISSEGRSVPKRHQKPRATYHAHCGSLRTHPKLMRYWQTKVKRYNHSDRLRGFAVQSILCLQLLLLNFKLTIRNTAPSQANSKKTPSR